MIIKISCDDITSTKEEVGKILKASSYSHCN